MQNRRYKEGIDRREPMPFPPLLDDYISADNPVRAIDSYVESLELASFGFCNAPAPVPEVGYQAGQPAYPPPALLKLYLYGYLNRVRSSRRLEKETHRNVEVMWLLQGLRPSYKTIADFRKDNAQALRRVNRDFVVLCKELDLFGKELVGIDGSFFRASASKASIYTQARLEQELKRIEQDIERYLGQLSEADRGDGDQGLASLVEDPELAAKLAALQQRQRHHQRVLEELEHTGEGQYSTTDPDARRLSKRGHTVAGYNVQHTVDAKHKLIVDHEVTHDGNDAQQLAPMALRAKQVLAVEELTATADSGYYQGEHLKTCVEHGITPFVAIPDKNKAIAQQGRYTRDRFEFEAEHNRYRCPAGQVLEQQGQPYDKNGRTMIRYAGKQSICGACALRDQCLTDKAPFRQLVRWEHEAVLDEHRQRMDEHGAEMMRKRAALAEHPFGTLKRWMGWDHFLVRGFDKVRGEMSLMVLGYNFTRVLNLLGLPALQAYCAHHRRIYHANLEQGVFA